ncbi:MAG: radical SAM protein [Planctomycetota bacterium]|nr:MAG: radical SAM protein [Planctomycetota bacterium]
MMKNTGFTASDCFWDSHSQSYKRVLFGTRKAKAILVDEGLWQQVKKASSRELESLDEVQTTLEEAGILVRLSPEEEFQEVMQENHEAAQASKKLYFVVQPTAMCQLGCTYCGQLHRRRMLSPKDRELFFERVREKLSQKKYDTLEIGWFGAEPLMGIAVMRDLSPKLKELAQDFECTYISRVVTNGISLTPKMAEDLIQKHNVYWIEVTIDGTEEFHNQRRPTKSGKGTFQTIFQNLIVVAKLDLDFHLSIRCNVDRENHLSFLSLVEKLAEHHLQDRISVYAAPVHPWGNEAGKDFTKEEFGQWELEYFAHMLEMSFSVSLLPKRSKITCMAVRSEEELVDAYGDLYNCTEVSYVPRYEREDGKNIFAIGNIRKGVEKAKRERLSNFYHEIEEGLHPCQSCLFLPVCGGACPKLWKEGKRTKSDLSSGFDLCAGAAGELGESSPKP